MLLASATGGVFGGVVLQQSVCACYGSHRMVVEETPSSCSCSFTFLRATTSPVRTTFAL